jgi:hypothetical protein
METAIKPNVGEERNLSSIVGRAKRLFSIVTISAVKPP